MAHRLVTRAAPLRFIIFCVVLALGAFAAIPPLGLSRGILTAFDAAAIVFLASVYPLLDNPSEQMRRAARDNDANRTLLLVITFVVTLVILTAVASEMHGRSKPLTLALVLATLPLAWLFSNVVYALHYANLYYQDGKDGADRGGLGFPSCDEPTYWDFIYFSFTLGMTFQTSDTAITNTTMRQVVTGHCLAAFVFNLGVLAFTINVIGGSGG